MGRLLAAAGRLKAARTAVFGIFWATALGLSRWPLVPACTGGIVADWGP
jgi:hypothetical protein